MKDAIFMQKQSEDHKDKINAKYRKVVFLIFAILFFSGIAILSMILERPKNQWVLLSSDSSGAMSSSMSQPSNPSSGMASGMSTGTSAGQTGLQRDSGALSSKEAGQWSPDAFPVYIVGEVIAPGIYMMEPGMFLYQLVDLAGGLTAKAARNSINLVFKITKNQMIRIPSLEEVDKGETGGVAEGLLLTEDTGFSDGITQQDRLAKININTADEKELDGLPGIGTATAKVIIDYRTKNGGFKAIEDIMKIPGIKQNKFAQIKDQITV